MGKREDVKYTFGHGGFESHSWEVGGVIAKTCSTLGFDTSEAEQEAISAFLDINKAGRLDIPDQVAAYFSGVDFSEFYSGWWSYKFRTVAQNDTAIYSVVGDILNECKVKERGAFQSIVPHIIHSCLTSGSSVFWVAGHPGVITHYNACDIRKL
jgi:hypothetical protein